MHRLGIDQQPQDFRKNRRQTANGQGVRLLANVSAQTLLTKHMKARQIGLQNLKKLEIQKVIAEVVIAMLTDYMKAVAC